MKPGKIPLPAQRSIDNSKESSVPSNSKRPSVSETLVQQLSEDKELKKAAMTDDMSELPSHNGVSGMPSTVVGRDDKIQSHGTQSARGQNENEITRNSPSRKHSSGPNAGQGKESDNITTGGVIRHDSSSASDKSSKHTNSYKSNTCSKNPGVEVSNSGNQVGLEIAVVRCYIHVM